MSTTYDVRPRLTFLAVLLAIGVLAGMLVGRELTSPTPTRVSDADYVAMVADLFDRERSVLNARERLALIGQTQSADFVDSTVKSMRESGTARQRDLDLIDQLARSLRETNPSQREQFRQSETASAGASSEPTVSDLSTIARLLVFILVVGIIGGVLVRSGVLSVTTITGAFQDAADRARQAIDASRRRRESARRQSEWAADEIVEPRPSVTPQVARAPRLEAPPAESHAQPSNGHGPRLSNDAFSRAGAAVRQVWNGRNNPNEPAEAIKFEASYRSGDDMNDDLHPIIEGRNGILIGAFGLSPARRVPGGPVYGFTIWLHDYAGGDELLAIGLVTKGGLANHQRAIEEWQRRGEISDLFVLERGLHTRLRTRNVSVQVTLGDIEFAPDGHDTGVLSLTLRAEVATQVFAELHVH
ncbi:MAG TPA: hypothetical protein VMP10_00220 [Chloroflexota bacterium]|nr:hypothetical protein [Chloroflexota bacterium]